MQRQFYNGEEEYEPRITPKPMTKLDDCLTVPTVPEISLIFEKPVKRSEPSTKFSDEIVGYTNSVSPNLRDRNSYAIWKEQCYSQENPSSTTHTSPLYANAYNCCDRPSRLSLQNGSCMQNLPTKQDQICDMQSRAINARCNDRLYEKSVKLRCSNTNDSYNRHGKIHSPGSSKKQMLSCNSLRRTMCGVTDNTKKIPNNATLDPLNNKEQQGILCPQYPYREGVEIKAYPFPQTYAPTDSNCDMDNNETVKALLRLVNSQSEQIKNLQSQVDRLVRLQEESFRNKSACECSLRKQIFHPPVNCSPRSQFPNQGIKKNTVGRITSIGEKENVENSKVTAEENRLEVASLEQQSTKAFVEQKVSIGVMTSFEFTVQNSPFSIDSEAYEKKIAHKQQAESIDRKNALNIQDSAETVKRYKNTFARKPGAGQLENIVEDSESYLSSSQQQSSNLNASSSTKDLETHIYSDTVKQSDLHERTNTLEPSDVPRHLNTNLNWKKPHDGVYLNGDDKIKEETQNRRNRSNEIPLIGNTNKYVATLGEQVGEDNEKINKRFVGHSSVKNCYSRNKQCDTNSIQINNGVGDSIVLSGGELKVLERPPPTPEPSIHVEMQEYSSDDESDKMKRTSKIGWTFYNNILGQVNEILQSSGIVDDRNEHDAKGTGNTEQEDDTESKMTLNNVKAATFEQLRRLGISLTENNERKESNGNNKTSDFDSSFYPRLDRQANTMHTESIVNETNTSMHMKALALKYLSDEQLTDIAMHKQGSSSLKQLMLSNMQGTNMSFATMRYLERYQLLPGRNIQADDAGRMHGEMTRKRDPKPAAIALNNPMRRQFPIAQTPRTTCPSRILDISTLKQQPKLL